MSKISIITKAGQARIKTLVKELHKTKNDFNLALKEVNSIPGLEISVEALEAKADGQPVSVTGIEVSVKQEIYP